MALLHQIWQGPTSAPWCRLWYVEPVVQLRQYAPYLVAEVTVESDTLREALTSGFKQVTPAKSIIQLYKACKETVKTKGSMS